MPGPTTFASLSALVNKSVIGFWRFPARNYPEERSEEGYPKLSARNHEISHYTRDRMWRFYATY